MRKCFPQHLQETPMPSGEVLIALFAADREAKGRIPFVGFVWRRSAPVSGL